MYDFTVYIAQNPLEALSALQLHRDSFHFNLVLSDIRMSIMSALEFQKLVDQHFHIPVICKIFCILNLRSYCHTLFD